MNEEQRDAPIEQVADDEWVVISITGEDELVLVTMIHEENGLLFGYAQRATRMLQRLVIKTKTGWQVWSKVLEQQIKSGDA